MKCAIMQPTYLPWSGYFNLIKEVDYFVILDDIQFNKRSWQQRNRILQNGQELYLSIPVFTKGKREQKIYEVEIDNQTNWRESHLKSLTMSYSKSPYKNELLPFLVELYKFETSSLLEFNIKFIELMIDFLGLKTKIIFSKDLPLFGKKSSYLLEICEYLGCNTYLSPVGSKEYIEEERIFESSDVKVIYQSYKPCEYNQLSTTEFVSHLSIIDVVFNLGREQTKKYI